MLKLFYYRRRLLYRMSLVRHVLVQWFWTFSAGTSVALAVALFFGSESLSPFRYVVVGMVCFAALVFACWLQHFEVRSSRRSTRTIRRKLKIVADSIRKV